MDIKVIVATHKKYKMPTDKMYLPLFVGAHGKEDIGFTRDDTGENISEKNPSFCELTGLYWGWKNLNCSHIGLTHYRRHFKGNNEGETPFDRVISRQETEKLLSRSDVILTKKRRYFIESIYRHYEHTLYVETLDRTAEIISDICPEYRAAFDKCMKRRYMHAFNMFIMKKEICDKYCEWLFKILFRLEDELKDKDYSNFHKRYPGRVAELLLDVWIEKNGLKFIEVPYICMESINYTKKGKMFFLSKIFNRKYEESY